MPPADSTCPAWRPVVVRDEKRGHQADLSQPCPIIVTTGDARSEVEDVGYCAGLAFGPLRHQGTTSVLGPTTAPGSFELFSPDLLRVASTERAERQSVGILDLISREERMRDGSPTPTVDQLRKEIDRGQTADKTPGVDPAAAPLGTDDEAGGNPPTAEQRAMEAEARPRRSQASNSRRRRHGEYPECRGTRGLGWSPCRGGLANREPSVRQGYAGARRAGRGSGTQPRGRCDRRAQR